MLKTNKSIMLNGSIVIDNELVVNLYADVTSGTVNVSITNKEIYDNNKKEVREEIQKFNELLYNEQDNFKDISE